MKGTLPRRAPVKDAHHVPDRSRETAFARERQTHALEGTLTMLRNDGLISAQEFAVVCRRAGLFEYPQQSLLTIARELHIHVGKVKKLMDNVLGKIRGHQGAVLERFKEARSTIQSVDDVSD
jgi:predicted transcriptional regulator